MNEFTDTLCLLISESHTRISLLQKNTDLYYLKNLKWHQLSSIKLTYNNWTWFWTMKGVSTLFQVSVGSERSELYLNMKFLVSSNVWMILLTFPKCVQIKLIYWNLFGKYSIFRSKSVLPWTLDTEEESHKHEGPQVPRFKQSSSRGEQENVYLTEIPSQSFPQEHKGNKIITKPIIFR